MMDAIGAFNGNRKWTLLRPARKVSCRGDHYWSFRIANGTREYPAVAWLGEYQGPDLLTNGQQAFITGRWVEGQRNKLMCSLIISPADAEPVALEQARIRARAIMLRMPDGNLKDFVRKIFQVPDTRQRYFNLPASRSHHHAYRHGLFIHSVDAAWRVYRDTALQGSDKWVTVVAALLHDIGKVHAYRGDGKRKSTGHNVDHEQQGLFMLDQALRWLEDRDPDVALMLRHHLTWHPRQGFPQFIGAAHARLADHASAASDMMRRSGVPS